MGGWVVGQMDPPIVAVRYGQQGPIVGRRGSQQNRACLKGISSHGDGMNSWRFNVGCVGIQQFQFFFRLVWNAIKETCKYDRYGKWNVKDR